MIIDKLLEKIDEKRNPCVVGLDPIVEKLPPHLLTESSFTAIAEAFKVFNFAIIDAIHDLVPAIKPQMACYEKYGAAGVQAFEETVAYAKEKGLIVIGDAKRGDIGHTAKAYAEAHLGKVFTPSGRKFSTNADWLTVNPYLGKDGLDPFVKVCEEHDRGIFILVKTSNPSSGQWQDRLIDVKDDEVADFTERNIQLKDRRTELYNLVGLQVHRYAKEFRRKRGYSAIGAVVGATYPEQAATLRKLMPYSLFLVPGYGAQGGKSKDIVNCFNNDGYGAVINSSRGIIYAWETLNMPRDFARASRNAVRIMITDIQDALKDAGKWPHNWN